MNIRTFTLGDKEVAEIVTDDIVIRTEQDALDLIGNAGSRYLVLHEHHFEPDFFDLSTRKLGEILQKFTNYHINVAVIGDFDRYPSKSLQAFIYETNKHGKYLFVKSLEQVKDIWR